MNVGIARNEEHDGMELSFDSKPSPKTIEALKAAKFRWHSQKKVWFAKDTPENRDAANKIIADAQVEQ